MSEETQTQQSEAEQTQPRVSTLLVSMLKALNPIFLKFEQRLEEGQGESPDASPKLALELSILVDGDRVHIGHGVFPAEAHPLLDAAAKEDASADSENGPEPLEPKPEEEAAQ